MSYNYNHPNTSLHFIINILCIYACAINVFPTCIFQEIKAMTISENLNLGRKIEMNGINTFRIARKWNRTIL